MSAVTRDRLREAICHVLELNPGLGVEYNLELGVYGECGEDKYTVWQLSGDDEDEPEVDDEFTDVDDAVDHFLDLFEHVLDENCRDAREGSVRSQLAQ
jgi:hypothetical protein